MPTKKPKLYTLKWTETIEYSAVVETDWTPDEIQAHALSTEYSEDEGKPVWQMLIEDQILEPRDHVKGRELEYLGATLVDANRITAENLPRDKVIALVDHIREELLRKADITFHENVLEIFKQHGLAPADEGVWGVLDALGEWAVYLVSEEAATAYWEAHEGSWKLCTAITVDRHGNDHYITLETRGG